MEQEREEQRGEKEKNPQAAESERVEQEREEQRGERKKSLKHLEATIKSMILVI